MNLLDEMIRLLGQLGPSATDEDRARHLISKGVTIQRYGTWIISSDGWYPYCSICNNEPEGGKMTTYCPSCGARMDMYEDKN